MNTLSHLQKMHRLLSEVREALSNNGIDYSRVFNKQADLSRQIHQAGESIKALSAEKLKSVAAGLNGDLLKLTYLVGGLGEVGRSLCKNEPVLVTPGEWKGQLPKDVVCYRLSRVDRKLGGLGNHESDAVGMGIAAQGGL